MTGEELLALAGLLRVLVLADRAVDGYELDALDRVGRRLARAAPGGDPYRHASPPPMGSVEFRAIFGQASRALPDGASVRAAAEALERPEAREAIFTILLDVAASNGIAPEEQAILDWLKDCWQITPTPLRGTT